MFFTAHFELAVRVISPPKWVLIIDIEYLVRITKLTIPPSGFCKKILPGWQDHVRYS